MVTGASRGGGRGIATVLGQTGATIYVTGRSTRRRHRTREFPWTIDETAEIVRGRGGIAFPVRCDHRNPRDVKALFERIRTEQGRLDLLVNNAWGGYERNDGGLPPGPFWRQPWRHWDGMFEGGLRPTLLTSAFAVPLMLRRGHGLIINTLAWDRGKYLGNLYYDVAKQAVRRATLGMALELTARGISALGLAPGFMRSELVMKEHRRHPFSLRYTESTEYVGRAVASLASDPHLQRETGSLLTVGNVAKRYRFTDIDGRWIPPFRIPKHHLMD